MLSIAELEFRKKSHYCGPRLWPVMVKGLTMSVNSLSGPIQQGIKNKMVQHVLPRSPVFIILNARPAVSFFYGSAYYVTGSRKTDQLEQILVLSNSQIYRLQCIIS